MFTPRYTPQVAMVVLAVLLAAPVVASPTALGPTGLLVTPNTDTVEMSGAELAGWWVDDRVNSGTLNYGLLSQLEITGSLIDPENGDSEGVLSAKWRFNEPSLTRPSFAVGVIDVTDQFDITPYIVAQKGFDLDGTGVTAHLGFADTDSLLDGFFAGAEATLGAKYRLMLEYDGDDLNGGVRWPISDRVEATVGIIDDDLALSAMFRIR